MADEGRAQRFVAGNDPGKGRQSRARGLVLFVVLAGLAVLAVSLAARARHVANPRAITTTLNEAAARFSAP